MCVSVAGCTAALLGALAALLAAPAVAAEPMPNVAIATGAESARMLGFFDEVVLDPARVSAPQLAELRQSGVTVMAALPARPAQTEAATLLASLVRRGFGGVVIDACVASRGSISWAEALLAQARPLLPRGRIYWRCPQDRPPPRLSDVDGVIVEGLFTEPDTAGGRRAVSAELQRQRLAALASSFQSRGLTVVALDWLGSRQRAAARALAGELAAAGVVPYVRTGEGVGVGLVEPISRRVLALYDSGPQSFLPLTPLHRMAALPLEYLGYALEYWDIRRGMPPSDLAGQYAGIVSWFGDSLPSPHEYSEWLIRQLDAGVRVAIIDKLGATPTPALLERLGVTINRRPLLPPLVIVDRLPGQGGGPDRMMGFEAPARPLGRNLPALRTRAGTAHMTVRDADDQLVTPVVTDSWGGLALGPYVLAAGARGSYRWRIDPFAFFARALGRSAGGAPAPVPDVTTENGRRLLMVHIDGDGFHGRASLPDRPFAGEVIRREFLNVFRLPTTVSFVEAEIGAAGLNRRLVPTLESIAREIAALPHVELASHTYSHPFEWPREPSPQRVNNLTIPGYVYSARREIRGSVGYLQRRIAPPGKLVKAVLWSGNALPAEDVLDEVAALGLHNVNGFNCDEPQDAPALTQIPSLYRPVGPHMQVYAPVHNENVFIEPFRNGSQLFGFRKVLRLFDFTEKPRRLKPLGLYYHFYSGASTPAIEALRDVYLAVSHQPSLPLHLSEYSAKVREWPGVQLGRRTDGAWEVRGARALSTLRIDQSLGWPDLARSKGVIGVNDGPDGRFVALLPGQQVLLALSPQAPRQAHLVSANARALSWVRDGDVLRFRLAGHMPVQMVIGGCAPEGQRAPPGATLDVDTERRVTALRFVGNDTGDVVIDCVN